MRKEEAVRLVPEYGLAVLEPLVAHAVALLGGGAAPHTLPGGRA